MKNAGVHRILLRAAIAFCLFALLTMGAGYAEPAVLELPGDLKAIEAQAFMGDTSLDEVVLPEGLERIGRQAFADSTLRAVNLPASLVTIADDAFDPGVAVTAEPGTAAWQWAVTHGFIAAESPAEWFEFIDNGDGTCVLAAYLGPAENPSDIVIPAHDQEGRTVTAIGAGAFEDQAGLSGSLVLPESLISIGESAFRGCAGLSGSLTIPATLQRIAEKAFENCRDIVSVTFLGWTIKVGRFVFNGCEKLVVIRCYQGSMIRFQILDIPPICGIDFIDDKPSPTDWFTFKSNADGTCTLTGYVGPDSNSENIVIPGKDEDNRTVTAIGERAFYNKNQLTGRLALPDSVTAIGKHAFYGCSGLIGNLIIPDGVTAIGTYAFCNCGSLNGELRLPDSLSSIGTCAFSGCSALRGDLTIPEGIDVIEASTFSGCGFDGALHIPYGVTTIGIQAFYGCRNLTGGLTIPDSVRTIKSSAFGNCSGLTGDLTIPDSVTSLERSAFLGCHGFDGSLTVSGGLYSIPPYAFSGCTGLSGDLVIPPNIQVINGYAFLNCSGFDGSLILPPNLTDIGTSAFAGCSGLTGDLIIPELVASIGSHAFQDCGGLDGEVHIEGSLTVLGVSVFKGCDNVTGFYCWQDSSAWQWFEDNGYGDRLHREQ